MYLLYLQEDLLDGLQLIVIAAVKTQRGTKRVKVGHRAMNFLHPAVIVNLKPALLKKQSSVVQ